MRTPIFRLTAFVALALMLAAPRAHAASKEIIQLQTQVQQLQDALQRLQSTTDERMGLIQHLLEQSADSVNKMTGTVGGLQKSLQMQGETSSGKLDSVSGQVQSVNDSVDELKSRIAKLDKELQDLQSQVQSASITAGGSAGAPASGAALGGAQAPAAPATSLAPPLEQLYQSGLRDYNAAKYDLASSEFSDVIKYYPQDTLAGNAQFYIGEIAYRQARYPAAIKSYDAVLEQFPGNPKAPAAQLRKGDSLIATKQTEAGVRELRSLIQRYPQTPEAQQARSRLNALGVRLAGKPTAGKEQ